MELEQTEIRFAQQLADNEKKQRDKSLKKLRKYLQARSASKKKGFTETDFLKLWKGLHYCMWMQDKPLIQEELSTKISQLVHDLSTNEAKFLFIKVFILTEAREWNTLDKWRLDKFMMMFRNVLTESLNVLKTQNWKVKVMERLMTVYTDTVLSIDEDIIPFSLRGHFMDIYLDEIHNVGGKKINTKQFIQLVEPFIQFLLHTTNPQLSARVISSIFNPIIKRTARLNHTTEDEQSDSSSDEILFPDLQIDSKVIADHLFEVGKKQSTPAKKRELLYDLVKRLKNACEGLIPTKPELSIKSAIPKKMIGEAFESLMELENDVVEQKRMFKQMKKGKKKKKVTADGTETIAEDVMDVAMATLSEEPKVIIGKKRKLTDTDENQEPFTKMKRKKTAEKEAETSKEGKADESKNSGKKKGKKSSKSSDKETVLQSVVSNGDATVIPENTSENLEEFDERKKPGKKKGKKESKNSDKETVLQSVMSNGDAVMLQAKPTEELEESDECKKMGKKKEKKVSKSTIKDSVTPVLKSDTSKGDDSVIEIKPSEDLEDDETEIFVPSKKYKGKINMSKFADFEMKKTPVAFVKRALSKTNKNSVGTPAYVKRKVETPGSSSALTGSAKRVSFNVKKNQSQSFKDSLKSPIVPFNPLKTPDQSILKTSTKGSVVQTGSGRATRRASTGTLPSSGSLKSLKTPKRTPKTPKSAQKIVSMKTPVFSMNTMLKRKRAADFFAL